jgi:hypothetical protein
MDAGPRQPAPRQPPPPSRAIHQRDVAVMRAAAQIRHAQKPRRAYAWRSVLYVCRLRFLEIRGRMPRTSSIGKRLLEEKTRSIDQKSTSTLPAETPFLDIADDLEGPFRLISDIALGSSTVYLFLNLP